MSQTILSTGNIMAHDAELEKSVMGYLITNPDSYVVLSPRISEESFYESKYRQIYKAIINANKKGLKPDMVFLGASFLNDPSMYVAIAEAATSEGIYQSVDAKVELLEELRKKRVAQEMGLLLLGCANKDISDIASIMSKHMTRFETVNLGNILDKVSVTDNIVKKISENRTSRTTSATMTGFDSIDRQGGFIEGMLIVVSAESSTGKSAYALSILTNAMRYGDNIALYSMEMTSSTVGTRLLNTLGLGLRDATIQTQCLSDSDNAKTIDKIMELRNLPGNFFIDDSSKTNINNIIASIRRLKREKNIKGVIVDYIQILNVYSENKRANEEKLLADASRLLQAEAKASGVWIMLLSQLSRPAKGTLTHYPTRDLIRGSGQILEASDMSIMLYRPYMFKESYPDPYSDVETDGTAMMIINKNRNGESNIEEIIGFNPVETRFYQIDGELPRKRLYYSSSVSNEPDF